MSSRSFEQDIVLDLESRLPERVARWIIFAGGLNAMLSNIDPGLRLGLVATGLIAWVQTLSRWAPRSLRATWSTRTGWRLWQGTDACETVMLEAWRWLPALGVILTWRRSDGRRERRMIIPRLAGATDCRRLRVWLRFDPASLHG